MKQLPKPLAVVLLLAWVAALPAGGQAPDLSRLDIVLKAVPDGPIAKVNDDVIDADVFTDVYSAESRMRQRAQGGTILSEADRVRLGVHCLGLVIEQEVLRQEAVKRKLTVSDEDVDRAWGATLEMARNATSGGENFSEQRLLAEAGATREEALSDMRTAMLIEKAREVVAKDQGVMVTEAEIIERFDLEKDRLRRPDQIHMKQIFVGLPTVQGDAAAAGREDARTRASAIHKQLSQGRTFEALARTNSDGPGKENGGDMGLLPANALPPFLVEAAKGLAPGEVSGVIESSIGFHVIKLVDTVAGEEPDLERARRFIESGIMATRSDVAVRQFVREQMEAGVYLVESYLDLDRQLRFRPELRDELRKEITLE